MGRGPGGATGPAGTDFAYGGAETGTTAVHAANPIDLPGQLQQFEAQVPHPDPNALYTVWIGSNDVMDATSAGMGNPTEAQTAVAQAAANEATFLNGLVADGARHLLVLDVPDLGVIPHEADAGAGQAALASSLSRGFDADLGTEIAALERSGQATVDTGGASGRVKGQFLPGGAEGASPAKPKAP